LIFKDFVEVDKLALQQPGQFLTQGGLAAPHKTDEIDPHKKKRFCP